MTFLIRAITICLALALLPAVGATQTTISENKFQPAVGTAVDFVFVGFSGTDYTGLEAASGANQTWDVTGLFASGDSTGVPGEVIDAATAPEIADYPDANLVWTQAIEGVTTRFYNRSLSTSFEELGAVNAFATFTVTNDFPTFTFPLSYNDAWTIHTERLQVGFIGNFIDYDTTNYTVDGYGTFTFNGSSTDALRVKYVTRSTVTSGGTPVSQDVYEGLMFFNMNFEPLAIVDVDPSIDSAYIQLYPQFVDSPTDVREITGAALPDNFTLAQNYPNPFNPTTEIQFSLPHQSEVNVSVINALGQQVRTLVSEPLAAGTYTVEWDGTNDAGQRVASGVYLYRLSADRISETKKMVLLK